jgi:hypothetical protein
LERNFLSLSRERFYEFSRALKRTEADEAICVASATIEKCGETQLSLTRQKSLIA